MLPRAERGPPDVVLQGDFSSPVFSSGPQRVSEDTGGTSEKLGGTPP